TGLDQLRTSQKQSRASQPGRSRARPPASELDRNVTQVGPELVGNRELVVGELTEQLDDGRAGTHALGSIDEIGPRLRAGREGRADVVDPLDAGDRDDRTATGNELTGHRCPPNHAVVTGPDRQDFDRLAIESAVPSGDLTPP